MATPIPRNTCRLTLAEIARLTGGRLKGDGAAAVRGISTDSRTVEPGGLFVALKGASHDGHDYLDAAAGRGVAAALVLRGISTDIAAVEVDDTLRALGDLAAHHARRIRAARPVPTLAIGGAVGKTTTKELAAATVRALFGPTLSTAGNLNNLVGVPMTLLTLRPEHRAMVIECGTNTPGEIPRLGSIVNPDAALVLNVDIEHTEGLGSLDRIADEEAALFAAARRAVVYGADEPLLEARLPAKPLRRLSFGTAEGADVRVVRRALTDDGRSIVTVRLEAGLLADHSPCELELQLRLLARSAGLNAAAAIAAAAALHERPLSRSQLDAIAEALMRVEPVAGRLALRPIGKLTVIDDSYNASPRAVREALLTARELADRLHARLVVALGDMLELGAFSKAAHREAVARVLQARPEVFLAVGPQMTAALTADPVSAQAIPRALTARDSEEAAGLVAQAVRPGDIVLVKGSLGTRMGRVIASLERI